MQDKIRFENEPSDWILIKYFGTVIALAIVMALDIGTGIAYNETAFHVVEAIIGILLIKGAVDYDKWNEQAGNFDDF